MRRLILGLIAGLTLVLASCGSKQIYPVTGKVLVQGRPAAGATVFFHRQGVNAMNEHLIMGIVQEDGAFDLVCGPLGRGAPPGEYDVLIEWKDVPRHNKGRALNGPDKLKGRYADQKHPRFHVTIQAGPNNLDPFELTD